MQYISYYHSPMGRMLLTGDVIGLTGVWFDGAQYSVDCLEDDQEEKELPVFGQTKEWLNIYFSGGKPDFTPYLHMIGSAFQLAVWEILLQIPYGKTTTYGEIASKIAKQRGMSKISIIVPCHRVIGANGSLTGYAGGLDKKEYLLTLEGIIRTEEKGNIPRV